LTLPGGNARFDGRIGPDSGAGSLRMQIDDASAVQRWVEALPGQAGVFAGAAIAGAAQLDARWQGGWQTLQGQLANPGAPGGDRLRLQATLTAPRLDLRLPGAAPAARAASPRADANVTAGATTPPPADATTAPAVAVAPPPPTATAAVAAPTSVQVRGLRAELAGSPADATLDFASQVTLGTRQFQLRTRAGGGLAGPQRFRLSLASLRLETRDTSSNAAPWVAELDRALEATVRRIQAPAPGGAPRLDVEASAGRATLRGPAPGTVALEWQPIRFSQVGSAGAGGGLQYRLASRGRLLGLPMAWAEALGAGGADAMGRVGISGDLVFDGEWDIDAGDRLRASARLARRSGDLRVQAGEAALVTRIRTYGTGTPAESSIDTGTAGPSTPAGLKQAELVLGADGEAVRAQLTWDSERAGQIRADASTRVVQREGGWQWPADAALSGRVSARLPDVGVWSMLAPPGWRVQGTLEADATIGGSRAAPQWSGTLSADRLGVKAQVEGIDLRDGRLRAALRGERIEITEFELRGGPASRARIAGQSGNLSTAASEAARDGGTLRATGTVSLPGAAPASGSSGADSGIRMSIDAEADNLRLLVRSDRQASVSGRLKLGLAQGQFTVRGDLRTTRAVIILPDETAPSLGTDVVVRSAAKDRDAARLAALADARTERAVQAVSATANVPKPPDIAVGFDLGNDFAVQGRGITTRLEGKLDIRSNAATGSTPRVFGEIRTVKGQFRAYGQQLDVEAGVARFGGAIDNPALDILAIRPNIAQRAGVRITGSALAPRVKLYSEPALSDAETLSWVVLGRASASGGAEALLMQQAALALLGGLGEKGSGNLASRFGLDEIGFKGPGGGEDVRSSAITLGKRLSKDFYVTYERSLAGTLGTLYIFYDLTRRLTLRGQTGARSAVDLIYTYSFD
ncbi:MAG: translocation/assembly module TamB, partial [Alcaligenaceae bacterium]